MKQDDIATNRDYRTEGGGRVKVLQKGVRGLSGRRDSVRVKFIGGRRDGQEGKLQTRDILHPWGPRDEEQAEKRAAVNKKVGAARVRLATLGFTEDEIRVNARADGLGLFFWGAAANRVLSTLERASEDAAA